MVGGQHAVIAGEVDAGLRHQGSQTCDEIHRPERHLRRPIPVGCLQGIENLTGRTEREARKGNGRTGDVPAESLPFILLMPLTAHAGVEGEAVGFGYPFQSRVRPIQQISTPTR